MQKIIIVRHGEYDKDDKTLTEDGKSSIASLARRIAKLTKGYETKIFYASSTRTQQTAEILAELLEAKCEKLEILECSTTHHRTRFVDLVRDTISDNSDIAIWVTHETQVATLPGLFGRFDRQLAIGFFDNYLVPGEAFVIDLHEKTMTRFNQFGEEVVVFPKIS